VSDSDESSAHEDAMSAQEDAMSAQEDAAVEGERHADDEDEDEGEDADEEAAAAAAAAADESDACVAAAEESTWEVLSLLLGFTHRFDPADCARLLYSRLSRALLVRAERGEGGGEGEGGGVGEETEEDDEEDEEDKDERRADLIRAPHNWMVPNSAPRPTPLAARVSTLLDRLSIGTLSTALSPRP
jgi:hypothetical protein